MPTGWPIVARQVRGRPDRPGQAESCPNGKVSPRTRPLPCDIAPAVYTWGLPRQVPGSARARGGWGNAGGPGPRDLDGSSLVAYSRWTAGSVNRFENCSHGVHVEDESEDSSSG